MKPSSGSAWGALYSKKQLTTVQSSVILPRNYKNCTPFLKKIVLFDLSFDDNIFVGSSKLSNPDTVFFMIDLSQSLWDIQLLTRSL